MMRFKIRQNSDAKRQIYVIKLQKIKKKAIDYVHANSVKRLNLKKCFEVKLVVDID